MTGRQIYVMISKGEFNPKIPYLAGLVTGDGHLEPGNNRVVISSSDDIFSSKIEEMVGSFGINCSRFWDEGGNQWKIAFHSEKMRQVLENEYNIISGDKTKTMSSPDMPEDKLKYFLAGLFDAEGWCEIDKEKYLKLRIKMSNKDIIDFVYGTLRGMRYAAKHHKRSDGSFVVSLYRQNEVKKFLQTIMLKHPKWKRFKDF